MNAPVVDLSYKWAGGGLISTVGDIVKFGNIILYSSQWTVTPDLQISDGKSQGQGKGAKNIQNIENKTKLLPGYLGSDTVKMMWTPVDGTGVDCDPESHFGLGWAMVDEKHERGLCEHRRFYVAHTGGSVGASSILLILPPCNRELSDNGKPPKGVVVAILGNLQSSNFNPVAKKIAKLFEKVDVSQS